MRQGANRRAEVMENYTTVTFTRHCTSVINKYRAHHKWVHTTRNNVLPSGILRGKGKGKIHLIACHEGAEV